jgi:hypothetical protein
MMVYFYKEDKYADPDATENRQSGQDRRKPMQCRSCGASLSSEATVCPDCQTTTIPYHISTSPSEEANPYEDPIYPLMEEMREESKCAENSISATKTSELNENKENVAQLATYGSTLARATKPIPDQAGSARSVSNSVQSHSYRPGEPFTPPRPDPLIVQSPDLFRRTGKSRLWLSLLTVGMVVLVSAVMLIPIIRGVHPVTGPSGNSMYADAAAIIEDAQTASMIDITTQEVTLARTFKVNTEFYIILTINPNHFDFSHYIGYYLGDLYLNNKPIDETQVQHVDRLQPILTAKLADVGTGALEIYWCTEKQCNDRRLARYVTFAITS